MILRRSRRAKSASAQATARPCWARAAYITKPRGELHTMWNAGTTPARMIEVISPAGFENFFRDLTDLTTDGAPPFEAIATLAEAFGIQFGERPWLPDLIARGNLTPPG
jgi:hypothetical protein